MAPLLPEHYLSAPVREYLEQAFYARVNEQAKLENLIRDPSFLENVAKNPAFYSDHGIVHVRDVARQILRVLQTINGVANAQILGGQTFAMRIWLDPDRMASLGVTPLDVRVALAANNFTSAPGQVKGDFVQTNIDAKTSLDDPAAFGRLVVMGRGDSLVRLSDIDAQNTVRSSQVADARMEYAGNGAISRAGPNNGSEKAG